MERVVRARAEEVTLDDIQMLWTQNEIRELVYAPNLIVNAESESERG